MITSIIGMPGAGKTMRLVWMMSQYVNTDRLLFTNVTLTNNCPFQQRFYKLDDDGPDGVALWPVFNVIDHPYPGYYPARFNQRGMPVQWYRAFWHFCPEGSVIFVAEMTNYFDSLNFASMPEQCRNTWTQHRKDKYTIICDYQNLDNLYNRCRRMCENFILCEHTYITRPFAQYFPVEWSAFVMDVYGHEQMRDEHRIASGHLSYREAQTVFQWYDTYERYGGWSRFKKEVLNEEHVFSSFTGLGEARLAAIRKQYSAIDAEAALVAQMGDPRGPGRDLLEGNPDSARLALSEEGAGAIAQRRAFVRSADDAAIVGAS